MTVKLDSAKYPKIDSELKPICSMLTLNYDIYDIHQIDWSKPIMCNLMILDHSSTRVRFPK